MKMFVGARVYWRDENGFYHFGVVFHNSNGVSKVYDDLGKQHTQILDLDLSMYEGWVTEKLSGTLKELNNRQTKNAAKGKNVSSPPQYFKRTSAKTWGLPFMRSAYAWGNVTYFGSKLWFKNKVFPPFGLTKDRTVYGVYYTRTSKLNLNPSYLVNFSQATATMLHEMIHVYDHLVRKKVGIPNYDAHGEFFQKYALKIEKSFGVPYIVSKEDCGMQKDIEHRETLDIDLSDDPKVSINDIHEKTSKPYWLVLILNKNFEKVAGEGKAGGFHVLRTNNDDKAQSLASLFGNSTMVAIYEMNLKYFEETIPTAGRANAGNVLGLTRKISSVQLALIEKHGEAMHPYGDLIGWYNKKYNRTSAK